MIQCRICAGKLGAPDYDAPAPAMTSLSTRLDVPTVVYVCRTCGHAQSPDLPDVQAFYDQDYRISLQSDDHDQLYAIRDGEPVYRTEHQADLVLSLDLPQGARVLDFGAAKASTLRRVVAARPDILPHVFDVSEDYRPYWRDWLPDDAQATYALPQDWSGKFDLITAHFVLEHVIDPASVLADMARCLAPGGRIFFSVPDLIGNPGDLLVADHLNHFVSSSLSHLLSGLHTISLRQDLLRGAHVVLARAGQSEPIPPTDAEPTLALLEEWRTILTGLAGRLQQAGDGDVAIYGAGFYGALFSGLVENRLRCFLDRNPHLQGGQLQGSPILAPEDCPEVAIVLAALNPIKAREILPPDAAWLPKGAQVIYPS